MERIKQALERAREERARRMTATGTPLSDLEAGVRRAAPANGSRTTGPIRYTQTRKLELTPRRLRRHRMVAGLADSALAVPFKVLRTRVLQRLRLEGWNALAVTSPGADAGKTLISVNLAIGLAQEINQTVLLVDLDLRKPSVHTYFDHEPRLGISDYVLHGAPLPDMLFNPGIDGLVVLPGRGRIAMSSEALSSPSMVRLVEELTSRYPERIVLFDVPPLLAGDDTIAFAPCVDAVLLVAREGRTTATELARGLELLGNTALLGTVLNDSSDQLETSY